MSHSPKGNIAQAVQMLWDEAEITVERRGFFRPRLSPDLRQVTFLSYHLEPKRRDLASIVLIPVTNDTQSEGVLGVEIVSPDNRIICQSTVPLSQVRSLVPVHLNFAAIPHSHQGVFQLRVFARDAQKPVHILESRFLPLLRRFRRWRTRALCGMTFLKPEAQDKDKEPPRNHDRMQEVFTQSQNKELTPELASFVGSASFEDHYWNSGWQTANVQIIARLEVSESIIDIGCGVGRLAYGLYNWFGGRYVGVDIVPDLIAYCKRQFPRFEFFHVDVKSEFYNPRGQVDPLDMVIPVESNAFDVAVLFSVYTHLPPDRMVRLTSEVYRVLKPNGRCLATFFILDGMTSDACFSFSYEWMPYCRLEKLDTPEAVVGYSKAFVVDTFAHLGFSMVSFYRGSWSGRGGLGLQDEMLFRKIGS